MNANVSNKVIIIIKLVQCLFALNASCCALRINPGGPHAMSGLLSVVGQFEKVALPSRLICDGVVINCDVVLREQTISPVCQR